MLRRSPTSPVGWNIPRYSLKRWLLHKVHQLATILIFLPTIWFWSVCNPSQSYSLTNMFNPSFLPQIKTRLPSDLGDWSVPVSRQRKSAPQNPSPTKPRSVPHRKCGNAFLHSKIYFLMTYPSRYGEDWNFQKESLISNVGLNFIDKSCLQMISSSIPLAKRTVGLIIFCRWSISTIYSCKIAQTLINLANFHFFILVFYQSPHSIDNYSTCHKQEIVQDGQRAWNQQVSSWWEEKLQLQSMRPFL